MYSFDGRVRYSEIDQNGRLDVSALVNYFQDCGTFQSEDAGVGIEYCKEKAAPGFSVPGKSLLTICLALAKKLAQRLGQMS